MSPEADPWLGVTLADRYRVERRIAAGGMGTVYAATQLTLQRTVAVKILHPAFASDARLVARLRREAEIVARLGHPNIVQVIELHAEREGPAFFVMEFVDGVSLGAERQRVERMPAERVAFIAWQMLDAVEAAHASGVVHRDLKPDNVLLAQAGAARDLAKLLDFGVAKVQSERAAEGVTEEGAIIGTPSYMAPEQARGEEVDARTDVYAVGVIMYELLSGRLPHRAATMSALLAAIAERPPAPLSEASPDVEPGLAAIVERAMAKAPSGRFASAAQMRDEIAARFDLALTPWGAAARAPSGKRTSLSPARAPHVSLAPTLHDGAPAVERSDGPTVAARPAARPARTSSRVAPVAVLGVAVLGAAAAALRFSIAPGREGPRAPAGAGPRAPSARFDSGAPDARSTGPAPRDAATPPSAPRYRAAWVESRSHAARETEWTRQAHEQLEVLGLCLSAELPAPPPSGPLRAYLRVADDGHVLQVNLPAVPGLSAGLRTCLTDALHTMQFHGTAHPVGGLVFLSFRVVDARGGASDAEAIVR